MTKTAPIERYSNVCRTCLSENFNMKSVFGVEEFLEDALTLSEILMTCASIQVIKGDGLPENVCNNCAQEMNRAFKFRKLCEKSDATLRDWTSSSKHTEVGVTFKIKKEEETLLENKIEISSIDVNKDESGGEGNESFGEVESEANEDFSVKHKVKKKPRKYKTLRRCENKIKKERNLPRTCDICNKTFRFHSNLERHKLIHTGEKPFLCNVCGKGFAQLSYLKIHSFIHTGEKPYKCKMCDKSFAAPGTLMTHIRTHTGERPHICKICGKDFPQSGYLSAHIRTHTGEKPVECKVCHRRFNQSGRLIIHMRIHSGEKPYSCAECGRSFAVNGTLKKHMRTHTGERPYICSVCGQAFAQSGTLATHMKVHRNK